MMSSSTGTRVAVVVGCAVGFTVLLGCGPDEAPQVDPGYAAEVEEWTAAREQRLRSENGWLTLVGLHWLEDGANTFGADADNDLVFPDQFPARAGTFQVTDGAVTIEVEPGVAITHEEVPVTSLELAADVTGTPTVLRLGTVSFYAIDRAGDVGIRVKDSASPVLLGFTGIERFPIDAGWRIDGRFEPYDPPKTVKVPNVIGKVFDEQCTGAVVFDVAGEAYRIDAIGEVTGELFLVFGDTTNGDTTYGGGRFLYADAPAEDGTVVVDFNTAFNPPCAFTPYATCPLPPPENKLPIAIEAGEKRYGEVH